jgi:hypothetical protein
MFTFPKLDLPVDPVPNDLRMRLDPGIQASAPFTAQRSVLLFLPATATEF